MRVLIFSTGRWDRGHYAPLAKVLRADDRFSIYFTEYASDWRNTIEFEPDVVLVLGDRYEALIAAASYVEARIPLVHIHGGEHTYGSLDERWRWAISAIADVHCVAHETAAAEVHMDTMMPQATHSFEAWDKSYSNIHITGAPGLDGIRDRKPLAFPHEAIIHYNPVIDPEQSKREFQAIVEGLGIHTPRRLFSLEQTLWIKMNGDRGSFGVGEELEPNAYRDELAAAKVVIGNTSAGIIEAPSLGTWFVNVGDRQKGRVRAGNVIDVPAEPERIREAVVDALSRPRYAGPNPYYIDGHASERIRDVLLTMA